MKDLFKTVAALFKQTQNLHRLREWQVAVVPQVVPWMDTLEGLVG